VRFFSNLWGGTLGTAATTGVLYQPRMIGNGDCGEIGGMKIGRRNRKISLLQAVAVPKVARGRGSRIT
jgi:hypothetical protein